MAGVTKHRRPLLFETISPSAKITLRDMKHFVFIGYPETGKNTLRDMKKFRLQWSP